MTFLEPFKEKIQIHKKTAETLDHIKPLTRKSKKDFGTHKRLEIKNKNKGENSENSSPHQNFENKSKNLVFIKILKRKV